MRRVVVAGDHRAGAGIAGATRPNGCRSPPAELIGEDLAGVGDGNPPTGSSVVMRHWIAKPLRVIDRLVGDADERVVEPAPSATRIWA